MIGAFSVGVIFSDVYLRSGSILPCMFYHTVHDIVAIAGESEVTENGIITGSNIKGRYDDMIVSAGRIHD